MPFNPNIPLPKHLGVKPRKRHDEIEADLRRECGDHIQEINRLRSIIWLLVEDLKRDHGFNTSTVDLRELPESWDLIEYTPTDNQHLVHLTPALDATAATRRLHG